MHILIVTIAVMGFVLAGGWNRYAPKAASVGVDDKQVEQSLRGSPLKSKTEDQLGVKSNWWLVQIHEYSSPKGNAQLLRFLHQFETEGQCEAVKARSDVEKLECRNLVFHTGKPSHENNDQNQDQEDNVK
jgi:hypothetical protein